MELFHEPPVSIKDYQHYQERYFSTSKPNIVFCPDIRMIKDGSDELKPYTEKIYLDLIVQAIISNDANPYILTFEDFPYIPFILEQADAILFYPGSDMPSSYYKEENRFCYTHRDSYTTFIFNQALFVQAPQKMPILGICYGSQFLNVVNGGSLYQDLNDEHNVHYTNNVFSVEKDTWLHKIVGDSMVGSCHHHQGIKTLARNMNPLIWDSNGLCHGFMLNDSERFVVGFQFHLERTHEEYNPNNRFQPPNETAQIIFKYFTLLCKVYSVSKQLRKSNLVNFF